MSSPATYGRCWANSTLMPWYGERCMPVIRPSTIRRARRSRAEMRASVLGSRYLRYSAAWGGSGTASVLYGKQRSLRGPAFGPSSGGFWNGPFARDARHVPDVDELE